MHYAKRLNVALEPFIQVNYNAYVHSTKPMAASRSAFATSRPISRAMSPSCWPRCTRQKALDGAVTKEDQEMLLAALQSWGALDANYEYTKGLTSSTARGFDVRPGRRPQFRASPVRARWRCRELLKSDLWARHRRRQEL